MIKLQHSYADLPDVFYSPVSRPNTFRPGLLARNDRLSSTLGLDLSTYSDTELANIFSATTFLPETRPIAMVYAAHQFGHWVPQLGDGRALLLGEIQAPDHTLYDVHLKGSGQTAYPRRGDGRSALGPVIREYLVSEGMYELGVPTTRSLMAVRTNDTVYRETEKPGGVLTRVALSHIRVGTFQFFASRGDKENLRILTDYTMKRLYPEAHSVMDFWRDVAQRQVELISKWMSFGFIHGVMNTDNMAISGETIDYGPCAFMDEFRFMKVFSSIDRQGRYAYGNQPQIAVWNLARLAECLLVLSDNPDGEKSVYEKELEELQSRLTTSFYRHLSYKLGISNYEDADQAIVHAWIQLMEVGECDFTLSFIDLERLLEGKLTFTGLEKLQGFSEFSELWKARTQNSALPLMKSVNPLMVPRNHLVEKAIHLSETGDDRFFFALLEAMKNPFRRQDSLTEFETPPRKEERVAQTFCGT